ncbi:hypothetical protein Pcinc_011069 [Petrolisthes cinctipes]|uniref:Uncharacterized protein n=1 Tax=Petrolisthes cinctipes TaxID=88211 RepID=A0AAE1G1Z9_PETCI|nr:hypothetical protein Pcinc_015300 [Petrolisthes cinctipes]KAK3884655.1 hypothetical protein Pcinc_011069 [Petrolisthes cinctipes]
MIGNIVNGIVCGRPTPLQIALGVTLSRKSLIEDFSVLGVTCTYDEVRLFKGSAAASASRDPSPIGSAEDGLIQTIAYNFDAEIASPNGLTSTHPLALLITQKIGVLPLKVLTKQVLSVELSKSLDFDFFKAVTSQNSSPEFGGFNIQHARREGKELKASTKSMYRPLIDAKPSGPTTIKTAMEEAKRLTTNLQLYHIALNVQLAFGDDFSNRLGGMHFLMSFVGAVGSLMSNSGLENIMKAAFGGVTKMLTGKNYPQNTRALRLVVEEVLRDTLSSLSSYQELFDELSMKAEASRTTKHWVNNLILPVFLMMIFVWAEREGDWALHLWAVKEMSPTSSHQDTF